MHNNEFYRGVLSVIKVADASNVPANPQPSAQTQPASQIGAKPPARAFNFGEIPLGAHQNVANRVNQNPQAYQPYVNRVMNYANQLPSPSKFDPSVAHGEVRNEMVKQVGNSAMKGFYEGNNPFNLQNYNPTKLENWVPPGFKGLVGGVKGVVNSMSGETGIPKIYSTLKEFEGLKPLEKLETGNQIAANNPEIKGFMRTQINKGIDENVGGAKGFGELVDNVTGKDRSELAEHIMMDNGFKAHAAGQVAGKAGSLIVDWLKDNWVKVAAGVGGVAGLLYLLKNMLGGDQQPQPTVINNYMPGSAPKLPSQSYL